MEQLYKLPKSHFDFISKIISNSMNTKECYIIAVGYALSKKYPIPNAQVDCIEDYFKANIRNHARSFMYFLNEFAAFDLDLCLDYMFMFYAARYNVAFPQLIVNIISTETPAAQQLFGINKCVASPVFGIVEENRLIFTEVNNGTVILHDYYNEQQKKENGVL